MSIHVMYIKIYLNMAKTKFFLYLVAFIAFYSCHSYAQQNITIKTNAWQDSMLILGYYQSENMLVADTVLIDSKGIAKFKSDTLLPVGIYTAYYPNKTYFDFLVSKDQTFSISVDTANYVESQEIKGSDESKAFSDYHKFMSQMQKERTALLNHYRPLIKNKDTLAVAQQKLETLNKQVSLRWKKDVENHKGTYYAKVINSLTPVEFIPRPISDLNLKKDSILAMDKYFFEANHYFDNTDLTEPGLWRTSFQYNRVNFYLNKILIPRPDSIIPYAIRLIEASKADKDCFRFMTSAVLSFAVKSDIMGMESLSVRIAKNYFLNGEAYWADSTLLAKMAELVAKEEHTLLGSKAPELVMQDWQQGFHSLHQVNAPYTILIFFEPNCSHCKKTIPEVYTKIWEKYKDKGLAVYCVYTQTDKEEWEEFIHQKQLYDWIHVWDPKNESNFRYFYDVSVTPRIFLLDENKTIIGKKIGVENLDIMLNRLYKFGTL